MSLLLATAVALFAGLMMTRVFKYLHLKFPDVTAFLIAGVLVGPFCLGALGVPGLGFGSMEELGGCRCCPTWRWASSPLISAMSSGWHS